MTFPCEQYGSVIIRTKYYPETASPWMPSCPTRVTIERIPMLLLIIILVLVLGGGGGYYGHSRWGYGGGAGIGLGTILLILFIAYMLGMFH